MEVKKEMAVRVEPRTVVVVEGPAGSGKSTLIQYLSKNGFRVIPRLAMPFRDYAESGAPALHSMIKDAYHLTLALQRPGVTVLDRFYLSQMVYQALREKSEQLPYTEEHHLLDFARILWTDYSFRSRHFDSYTAFGYRLPVRFIFLILLPPVEQIIHQRTLTGKAYPFDPVVEWDLYFQLGQSKLGPGILRYLFTPGVGLDKDKSSQDILDGLKSKLNEIGVPHVLPD